MTWLVAVPSLITSSVDHVVEVSSLCATSYLAAPFTACQDTRSFVGSLRISEVVKPANADGVDPLAEPIASTKRVASGRAPFATTVML